MWPLLREGLLGYRRVLLGALVGTTIGVAGVFAVLAAVGAMDARTAFRWAMVSWPADLLVASGVVGWIAIGTELTEQRLRLHLLLPFTIEHVALSRLLLPVGLLLAGLAVAHAGTLVASAVTTPPTTWRGHAGLDLIAVYVLFMLQLTFAVQEVTALGQTSRWKGALGILALVLLGTAVIAAGLPVVHVLLRPAAVLAVAVLTAAMNVTLFCRRPQLFR